MSINTGQFNDSFLQEFDEVAITVKNYAYYLNKNHGQTVVVVPHVVDHIDTEPYDVIRYKTIPLINKTMGRIKTDAFTKSLQSLLGDYQFDIVHAHSPFGSHKFATKLALERNIPIVASYHNCYRDYLKSKYKIDFLVEMYKKRIYSFYKNVDYVLVPDEIAIEELKGTGFKGKIDIIDNGSEYEWENDLTSYKEYINHRYDINKDLYVLLFVGELDKNNNLDFVLEVANNLKRLKQDFRLIIIGEGKYEDQMIKYIEQNKLSKFIIMVGQIRDRELLKTYYSRANLLLYPAVRDSLGLVIREAASFVCPSLGLKNTAVTNIIKDNYNGYLADNNTLLYAQRVIAVINDRNKVKVGLTAQRTLAKGYSKIVDDLAALYTEIINLRKQY